LSSCCYALHSRDALNAMANIHSNAPSFDTTTSTSSSSLPPTCNIITPVGMLGYGLSFSQTATALTQVQSNGAPTALILDSGSTDSGPEKLALGCMSVPRDAYKRDLEKLVRLAWKFSVPLIFSSAGGDGSDEHVRELTGVVRETVEERGDQYVYFHLICCRARHGR